MEDRPVALSGGRLFYCQQSIRVNRSGACIVENIHKVVLAEIRINHE